MEDEVSKLKFFEDPVSRLNRLVTYDRVLRTRSNCLSGTLDNSTARSIDPKDPPRSDLRWFRVEEWLIAKGIASNTERAYLKELKRLWAWTSKAWDEITTADLTRYKHELELAMVLDRKTGQLKRQLSANSVAMAVSALKSFFRWMQQVHYIVENPALAISVPSESEPESKELSNIQVQALYAALEQRGESRIRDTALLAILSHGLRAEEVSRLNIEDYDQQRLYIRQAKHGSTGRVPLDQEGCLAVDDYLADRKQQGERLTANSPMFINYSRDPKVRGQRLSYAGVYLVVKQLGRIAIGVTYRQLAVEPELELAAEQPTALEILEQVGWEIAALANVHPQQLRHTFASNLVLGGMDAYLAMALTRHRSISVFKRYSKKAREDQAERAFRQMRNEEIGHEQ